MMAELSVLHVSHQLVYLYARWKADLCTEGTSVATFLPALVQNHRLIALFPPLPYHTLQYSNVHPLLPSKLRGPSAWTRNF